MILKFLKKNQILLVIFLLISIVTIILTIKSDKPSTTKPELKQEKKTVASHPKVQVKTLPEIKQKVELKKQNLTTEKNLTQNSPAKTIVFDNKIDFMGKNDPLIYEKPKLEIDQIMEENKKINTFADKKYLTEKKDDWKVDYEVGFEEGAMEELKTTGEVKAEMLNGKIGFSKSF